MKNERHYESTSQRRLNVAVVVHSAFIIRIQNQNNKGNPFDEDIFQVVKVICLETLESLPYNVKIFPEFLFISIFKTL